jgi:DNA repair ATPase RecN
MAELVSDATAASEISDLIQKRLEETADEAKAATQPMKILMKKLRPYTREASFTPQQLKQFQSRISPLVDRLSDAKRVQLLRVVGPAAQLTPMSAFAARPQHDIGELIRFVEEAISDCVAGRVAEES